MGNKRFPLFNCVHRWIALAALLSAVPPLQAQTYSFAQLTVPGATSVYANGINNTGQVAGYSVDSLGNYTPQVWTGTVATALGTVAGETKFQAAAINDGGLVVGYSTAAGYGWNGTTPIALQLPTVGSAQGVKAYAVNKSGQIAGTANGYAVLWNGTTAAPTVLPTLYGFSAAYGINNSGTAVGMSYSVSGHQQAVVWSGTSVSTLGLPSGWTGAWATAINSSGVVVGNAQDNSGNTVPVVWIGGVPTLLGGTPVLKSGTVLSEYALGINDSGTIVGQSTTGAALWNSASPSSAAVDLNQFLSPEAASAGWTLVQATGINQLGTIVGIDYNTLTSQVGSFVLTPSVPEAQTYVILASGLLLAGLSHRFKHADA